MFEVSQAFHRARRIKNQRPVVLLVLSNAFGLRAYASHHPSRDELGLVGTAPLVGLEPAAPAEDPGALSDFDSRHAELGTMGAAPLYGMEPIADVPLEQSGEGAPFAEVAR